MEDVIYQINHNPPVTEETLKYFTHVKYENGEPIKENDTIVWAHIESPKGYILKPFQPKDVLKNYKQIPYPKNYKPKFKIPIIRKKKKGFNKIKSFFMDLCGYHE